MTDPTLNPPKKKLIEVALPLEAINKASAREKSIRHGHPSTLHLWWARRPLAACRAVLFASLVDDPSSDPTLSEEEADRKRDELFAIIEDLVQWENSNDPQVLGRARASIMASTGGAPPPVLDPFCGGGSIPLEAQRLGLEAHGSDLNPVAVLITKALIEIPPKFAGRKPVHPDARRVLNDWSGAQGLAADVRAYGAWMRDEAARRIGHLYPKATLPPKMGGGEATVIAWLWARTVTCPNPACGAEMPLVSSFALSTKKGKEAWLSPVVEPRSNEIRFEVETGTHVQPAVVATGTAVTNPRGKKIKATFRCLVCGTGVAKGDYIDAEAHAGRMRATPLAKVAELKRGRAYLPFSKPEAECIADMLAPYFDDGEFTAKLPQQESRGTFASNAQGRRYGFHTFSDYFTPRQLVALTTFSDLVGKAREHALADARLAGLPDDGVPLAEGGVGAQAYADAVATYLAFAVDRVADYGSTIATWASTGEFIRGTFARQALPMTWDFAEVNPLSGSTGNWSGAIDWIANAISELPAQARGTVVQADARLVGHPSEKVMVSTDPPYYDNIGYADLSDYFYSWLRRSLIHVWPQVVTTLLTPKRDELIASPYRHSGDRAEADRFFEQGLGDAFDRMASLHDSQFPLTVFYAFKQSEEDEKASRAGGPPTGLASTGWETMLEGLIRSGLSIDATWPMRTERSSRSISIGTNALASSIVLACRTRSDAAHVTTRNDFIRALRRELPASLRQLQHGNIAPVDLAQAAIGPGMAIYTRYREVREPSGDRLTVRTALALINQILDEILAEQEGDYDPYTRMAIALFESHGVSEAPYGDAETLATAKGTSVAALVEAGILASGRGKVRLLRRDELPADWNPAQDRRLTVWEITQHLIRALDTEGQDAAAALLRAVGPLGDAARDLAYRLYTVCERKGWSVEAQAYNSLVVAWPEVGRFAAAAPAAAVERQGPLM